MKLQSTLFLGAAAAAVAFAISACGSGGIDIVQNNTAIDTATMSAARDTNLHMPSGYSISSQRAQFTQDNSDFDFVYNIDDGGHPVFLTSKVLGVVANSSVRPGFRKSVLAFDSITTAPINGYQTGDTIFPDTIMAVAGRVWYIRSSSAPCASVGSPYYGKLEVLSIDSVARTITIRTLIDENCGFHSLRLGHPTY
jgi:hypothetical protein